MSDQVPIERITFRKLFHDITDILNLKRGIFYTLWELAKNPGKLIDTYLNHDRTRIINSFRLLILVVSISTFISLKLDIATLTMESGMEVNMDNISETSKISKIDIKTEIIESIKKNLSLLSFLLVPFMGLFTFWFFRKSKLFLAEHITAQAYLISFATTVNTILIPLIYFNVKLYGIISMATMLTYYCWYCFSIATVKNKFRVLMASLGGYLLSYALYSMLVGFIVVVAVVLRIKLQR